MSLSLSYKCVGREEVFFMWVGKKLPVHFRGKEEKTIRYVENGFDVRSYRWLSCTMQITQLALPRLKLVGTSR